MMNKKNREKLENIRKSFLEFLEMHKTKESQMLEDYKNMTLDTIIEDFNKNLSHYKAFPGKYLYGIADELGLDTDDLTVMMKLRSYFDMFDKVIDILL